MSSPYPELGGGGSRQSYNPNNPNNLPAYPYV